MAYFAHVGFNGTNASISAADTGLPATTAARTVAFWFRTFTTFGADEYKTAVAYGARSGTNAVGIGLSNASAGGVSGSVFVSQYGSGIFTSGAYNDGLWHLALATYTTGTGVWELFIDDVSRASGAMTTNTTLSTFAIGQNSASGEWYRGSIAHVRVYDYVLNSGQRTAVYNSGTPNDADSTVGSGLLAYYKLTETSGTSFHDVGTGNHDGTGSNISFSADGTASATVTVTPFAQPALFGEVAASITVTPLVWDARFATVPTPTIVVASSVASANVYAEVACSIIMTPKFTASSPYLATGRHTERPGG